MKQKRLFDPIIWVMIGLLRGMCLLERQTAAALLEAARTHSIYMYVWLLFSCIDYLAYLNIRRQVVVCECSFNSSIYVHALLARALTHTFPTRN